MAQGVGGFLRVVEVLARGRWGAAERQKNRAIAVPMKELNGGSLLIRPGTSDLRNASDYYELGLHLPPAEAQIESPSQVVELGCNIGAALTALATRFPEATVLGVEPDADNARQARMNTASFGERCTVVEAAIWDFKTSLVVDRSGPHGSHGFSVRPRTDSDPPELSGTDALDIDSLLARYMPTGEIDLMVINIEGTEPRVFAAGGEWTKRVRSMKVESHPDFGYPAEALIAQLNDLGFKAWPYERFPKFVAAVRS